MMEHYPRSMIYLLFCVTVILILQIIEFLGGW